jgi:hypothetical protein
LKGQRLGVGAESGLGGGLRGGVGAAERGRWEREGCGWGGVRRADLLFLLREVKGIEAAARLIREADAAGADQCTWNCNKMCISEIREQRQQCASSVTDLLSHPPGIVGDRAACK